ncbi:YeeE/YedE family protein [Nitrincola alkalilacustris]|uniref:YeeE/YedE family protein n=1 Tax=Nitrincola alkalilacustris TaxID=1571224 RepID=UPI00124F755F|nr:YeeE/YedE family protein [Nitrincola alkalilacustris]
MTIDWSQFTPWSSLAGGILIGISVSVLLLWNGRIAGISGVVGGILSRNRNELAERIAFIAGLIIAPGLVWMILERPTVQIDSGIPAIILAGLLVGLGSRLGSGCTSGHGVCGLARLSVRSLVATLTFMAAGFITVYVLRHLLGV